MENHPVLIKYLSWLKQSDMQTMHKIFDVSVVNSIDDVRRDFLLNKDPSCSSEYGVVFWSVTGIFCSCASQTKQLFYLELDCVFTYFFPCSTSLFSYTLMRRPFGQTKCMCNLVCISLNLCRPLFPFPPMKQALYAFLVCVSASVSLF